ncbi:MAG: zinc-binding dehydrogenase, partial [Allopontixanthobacter sediminis]
IAVLGGMKAEINMAQVMSRRLTMTGSTLRARPDTFKAAVREEIAQIVWPFVESGRLRPEMDLTFPLTEAAAAHERMQSGEHIGKIVLEM